MPGPTSGSASVVPVSRATRWALCRRVAGVVLGLVAGVASSAGCGVSGPYVWVQSLPSSREPEPFVIDVGDVVNVRVFEQESLNTRLKVRADGKMSFPFLGEVPVGGKQPAALAKELEGLFASYIKNPHITVNIDEFPPMSITVAGEVTHTGIFTFDRPPYVLQALAMAGTFTEDADKSAIFVLRRNPQLTRIRFTYDALLHNEPRAAGFALQNGDVVVVE